METSNSTRGKVIDTQDEGFNMPDEHGGPDDFTGQTPDTTERRTNPEVDRGGKQSSTRPIARLAKSRAHTLRASKKPQPTTPEARAEDEYDVPDDYANLGELNRPSPIQNPTEEQLYQHQSLEERITQTQEFERNKEQEAAERETTGQQSDEKDAKRVSKLATQIYVISYLILFSFFGTLARLGLQAITFYPGAPIVFSELWANFGGSLVMGFLTEDRMLFKHEWGTATYHQEIQRAKQKAQDEESSSEKAIDLEAAKKAHAATKKTIPLYIGLTTGFCGCFTSFSAFIRDVYFALANDMPTPLNHLSDYGPSGSTTGSTVPRNGGYSFMALLAVILGTLAICISGLHLGAHLAIATEPYTPAIPFKLGRKVLDRVSVFLAWGCWLGAILLAILPPDRQKGHHETWRGRAVFALVFAPLGCLGRFYASILLNSKIASFPLGTFLANIFGTAILGMCYDLQHVPLGGVVGCQVLQGIMDGFCGCLTTISTWVAELSSLRRSHAYRYGAASVVVALCFLIVIMGSLQWTRGFSEMLCTH